VNRSLPDAELDPFVEALATRIASFDRMLACVLAEADGFERRERAT
jgi:hypothetical protein